MTLPTIAAEALRPKSLAAFERLTSVFTSNGILLGQTTWQRTTSSTRMRKFNTSSILREEGQKKEEPRNKPRTASQDSVQSDVAKAELAKSTSKDSEASTSKLSDDSLPPDWEDDPDFNISSFSQLPHRTFGFNQHMKINEDFKEALRQMLWQFKAPIRYAFAYGSGVFPQGTSSSSSDLSPHPNPPEAVKKWQDHGSKVIDFIFGVSHTQHWHSLNLHQHREHYSFLGSFGSGLVSSIQDKWGAGVYFNPYITVNGTMIKYGVVNLETLTRDLSQWDTLYLAGRLQKPVKILRDDPRVRLANQVNLISAVRAALLMLPEKFTEKQLYQAIAGMSYLGDPRMRFKSENPNKVANIVSHQLPNFRLLYNPLVTDLPNVQYTDARVNDPDWLANDSIDCTLQQDMDPVRRGNMVRRLPSSFRNKMYFLYQRKFAIPGRDFKAMLEASKDEDEMSFKRREGGEFDKRIAGETDVPDMVKKAIRQTVEWPSASQSVKGFFSAGPVRSWKYMSEKRAKANLKKESSPGDTAKGTKKSE